MVVVEVVEVVEARVEWEWVVLVERDVAAG
jgi:hypothetical protein